MWVGSICLQCLDRHLQHPSTWDQPVLPCWSETSSSSEVIRRNQKPGKSNVSHTGKCIIIWALVSQLLCICLWLQVWIQLISGLNLVTVVSWMVCFWPVLSICYDTFIYYILCLLSLLKIVMFFISFKIKTFFLPLIVLQICLSPLYLVFRNDLTE